MKGGDDFETRFEALYAQYFEGVYRFMLSLCRNASLAEDITQETFLKALKHYRDFKAECSPATWLCRIAKNEYFSYLRKYKSKKVMLTSPGEAKIAAQNPQTQSIEALLLDKETYLRLHSQLHALEEPYREVFTLRVFGELSHGEIGALFTKTETWARMTYYRAKLKLQERLREHNE